MNPTQTVPELLAELWKRPVVRLLIYTAVLLLLFRFVRAHLVGVLVITAVSYGLAYIANPLLLWLEKRGLRRGLGVALLLISFLGLVVVMFWTLGSQVVNFITGLPAVLNRLPELLEEYTAKAQAGSPQERIADYVRQQVNALNDNMGPLIARLLSPESGVFSQVTGVLNWLGQFGLVLTLASFFMLDYTRFGRAVLQVFPKAWQPFLQGLSDDVSLSFGNYIRGQLIIGAVISALAAAILLVLKVPNAVVLGMLTGVLNFIPLIGMVLATIPVILQALPLGTFTLIAVCVAYFLLNQVAWNVIAPVIMGRTVQVSAAALMIAALIGASLAGLMGGLLAIPVAALIQRWVQRYWLGSATHASIDEEDLLPGTVPLPVPGTEDAVKAAGSADETSTR